MRLILPPCIVRSFEPRDAVSLARHANNRHIWINVRDRFPHPYERAHAQEFIRRTLRETPESNFAIEVDGEAVGGVGFVPKTDVERVSAEVGYWLGEPFWGRGIATAALDAITEHAVRTHQLTRLFAVVFAYNRSSCRVLEKCGYRFEARLARSAIKDGQVIDQLQYGYTAPE